MRTSYSYIVSFLLVIVVSCVEPYNPPELTNQNLDILVVDGFVEATSGTATVYLSKALPLNSPEKRVGLRGATVKVVADDGTEFVLQEQNAANDEDAGTYIATSLPIDVNQKYRLRVERDILHLYESDPVQVMQTPMIDKVYFIPDEDRLEIYVDSKEGDDKNRFYRWRIQETWEYHAPYTSVYDYKNGQVVFRSAAEVEELYTCYQSDLVSPILLGSTSNLSRNVVTRKLVNTIPRNSIKLSAIYSINVQQFSLSENEYSYWYSVDQMTENTGGLFDPMPGQVLGNIKNVKDPGEIVIGYFSASTRQESRIFVTRSDLPSRYVTYRPFLCPLDTILSQNLPDLPFSSRLVSAFITPPATTPSGYLMSNSYCVDCTEYSDGTPPKPDFWP